MKVYVHLNEVTGVFRDCDDATVEQLLQWIVSKHNARTKDRKLLLQEVKAQTGGAGRCLQKSDILRKVLHDCADVYIVAETQDRVIASSEACQGVAGSHKQAGNATFSHTFESDAVCGTDGTKDSLESSPVIQNLIQTANDAQRNKNFRHAEQIYQQLLCTLPPHSTAARTCLTQMVRLWLAVNRPSEALVWARKAAKDFCGHMEICELLGDCLSHSSSPQSHLCEALASYTSATELAIASGNKEVLTRLILAKARVLNRMEDAESKGRAASLIMEVVSMDQTNWDGLYHYAKVAADRGMITDAIRVLLRLLAEKPNHTGVRHALAEAVSTEDGLKIMLDELSGDAHTDAALAFLATCIKDYGAVQAATSLFRRAVSINAASTAYVLNLIHSLEILQNFSECIEVISSSCKDFQDMGITMSLQLDVVEAVLRTISDHTCETQQLHWYSIDESNFPNPSMASQSHNLEASSSNKVLYSSEQLDLLAIIMTAVKILFLGGALAAASQIVRVVEPSIQKSEKLLHTTLIRNEAAYFGCIQQILQGTESPKQPEPSSALDIRPIFLAGDSHCLSAAWQTVHVRGEMRLLVPRLITGCKIWHIRDESVFYPKVAFNHTMTSLPNDAQVIMLFGEIDCREGLLLAVEKCKYDSLEEGIDATISIYMDNLKVLLSRGMELFIHPIPPVLNETRHIVLPFNSKLQQRVLAFAAEEYPGRIHWLDFLDELLTPDGKNLKQSLTFDGTHLPPSYIRHLRGQFLLY